MISTAFFLVEITTVGTLLGFVFFLVAVAVAFITYRMLKKTVKMAVRMTIVVAILLIALVGSIAFLMFSGSGKNPTPKPASTRQSR